MCRHVDDGVNVGLRRRVVVVERWETKEDTYEGHSGEVPEDNQESPPTRIENTTKEKRRWGLTSRGTCPMFGECTLRLCHCGSISCIPLETREKDITMH